MHVVSAEAPRFVGVASVGALCANAEVKSRPCFSVLFLRVSGFGARRWRGARWLSRFARSGDSPAVARLRTGVAALSTYAGPRVRVRESLAVFLCHSRRCDRCIGTSGARGKPAEG